MIIKRGFVLLSCLISVFFICSCDKNERCDVDYYGEYTVASDVYTYPDFQDPEIWKNFYTQEERFEACMLPKDILKTISTKGLVASCMYHPQAYLYYTFYNGPLQGLEVLYENYNGLRELLKREDVIDELFRFYAAMDPALIGDNYSRIFSKFHLSYMELFLSLDVVESLYSECDLNNLFDIAMNHYQVKAESDQIWFEGIVTSLILSSKIILIKGNIGKEEKKILNNVIESRGEIFFMLYDYAEKVSRIVTDYYRSL